jgi:hypothetical protein
MTPRVGVKTTLTMERAFSGLPVPSGSPTFFGADRYAIVRTDAPLNVTKDPVVAIFPPWFCMTN